MENNVPITASFMNIYDAFLTRVTDDMYMELSEIETIEMLQDLLVDGLWRFEFPRFDLTDFELGPWEDMGVYQGIESDNLEVPAIGWIGGAFNSKLTEEEINILSLCMLIEWLGQQLNRTKLTEMMFSGSDFKLTSQANHMAKLKVMIDAANKDNVHQQRIYKRRRITKDGAQSTMGDIISKPSYGATDINRASGQYVGFSESVGSRSIWSRGRYDI